VKFVVRLGALCVLLFLGACVSPGESVVGRSAIERPAWVDGDVAEEPQKFVMVVFKKTDIYRLELGLKQAQAAALAAAPKLLRERVLRDVRHVAEFTLGVAEAEKHKASLDDVLALPAPLRDGPDASVSRTYHEEVQRESPTGVRISYDVFVLVGVSRHDYELQLLDIARRLRETKNLVMKKVGDALEKELSPENSSQE
jgi:hypothetical protein